MSDYTTGTGQELHGVHRHISCHPHHCPIHNPSDHHMKTWPTNWRGDRRMMERICEHGVGHPDPDDSNYRIREGRGDDVHGCDGCCDPKGKV